MKNLHLSRNIALTVIVTMFFQLTAPWTSLCLAHRDKCATHYLAPTFINGAIGKPIAVSDVYFSQWIEQLCLQSNIDLPNSLTPEQITTMCQTPQTGIIALLWMLKTTKAL